MANPHQTYEIRCPIHGFIHLSDWEWAIISDPAFQRLRRIRQLAWTDYVYPGAMHTRFEHSLGVMHTATLVYKAISERSADVLQSEVHYNDVGLRRDLQLVRLAALLHDVGHAPFSHAAEELMPLQEGGTTRFTHEQYSAAVVRTKLRSAIEDHRLNRNYGFKADDVAALLEGSAQAKQAIFWRDLIDGQMDADRMDYLLRDSYHAGVQYGRYDLARLIATMVAIPWQEASAPRLGVNEGGWHAAESLVLARYFMFTQVYFHKTRVAYDIHLRETLKELLPGGAFPRPVETGLDEYLAWDDWRVLGLLANGNGGEHGRRIATRKHFREIHHTPETTSLSDMETLERVRKSLGGLRAAEGSAEKSWYKTGDPDIPVISDNGKIKPLSAYSSMLANMKANNQIRVYAKPEDAEQARTKVNEVLQNP